MTSERERERERERRERREREKSEREEREKRTRDRERRERCFLKEARGVWATRNWVTYASFSGVTSAACAGVL